MSKEITKIETQKKNNARVSIFIDGEFSFGIYYNTLIKFDLVVGLELTDEEIEEIIIDDEYVKCFNNALNYISYQERTIKEVKNKLISKEYLNVTINKTIEELLKLNYLNDFEYAKRFIEVKIKKMGIKKIKYLLIEKGIDEKKFEFLLMNYSEEQQYEIALLLASKKNNQYSSISYQKRYSRLSGLLNRKGYSYPIINRVLSEILEDY
ncbi:MAG: RecX family transcriptional regulator [Bacillota bacterium]|nr:RecX family transcriptional regulator [Bacillota bacterium]